MVLLVQWKRLRLGKVLRRCGRLLFDLEIVISIICEGGGCATIVVVVPEESVGMLLKMGLKVDVGYTKSGCSKIRAFWC